MKYLLTALLFLAAPFIFAEDAGAFNSIVDFSVTLNQFEKILSGEQPFDPGKLVILDGSIGSVTVADKNSDSFLAYAELVKGEWDTAENIHIYSCYLEFAGPEFSRLVSSRPAAEAGIIAPNAKVIVVGKLVSVLESESGDLIAVVQALYARSL